MRLIQYSSGERQPCVGMLDAEGRSVTRLAGYASTYELARAAQARRASLESAALASATGPRDSYSVLLQENRVRCPLHHPDPAHCLVSGTGLTHLGSASARDAMHHKVSQADAELSDSMLMFKWGLDRGRPQEGDIGAQPEWFYKGNGTVLVDPGQPLHRPGYAADAGEEPEIVGLYVNDDEGTAWRLGFAIGNEFSDHVMERQNYLYLAHSKLRCCSIGPELNTSPLPAHLEGRSVIRRHGEVLWEKPFLTGEANMCHSIANLEHHHFKYAGHRVPGDVHVHFFGTATLSCADDIETRSGDVFEIHLPALGAALVNPLLTDPLIESPVIVRAL
jgi:hypothetical protein